MNRSQTAPTEVEAWAAVSHGRPCPCCGATDGCRLGTHQAFVLCRTVASPWPAAGGGWFHRLIDVERGRRA